MFVEMFEMSDWFRRFEIHLIKKNIYPENERNNIEIMMIFLDQFAELKRSVEKELIQLFNWTDIPVIYTT